MKPDRDDRPQSIRGLMIRLSSTEETLVENPIKKTTCGYINQSSKDSHKDKEYNVNVLEHNDNSSFWKYVLVALMVAAMIAGFIYYNKGGFQTDRPKVEKASYQDYFDK